MPAHFSAEKQNNSYETNKNNKNKNNNNWKRCMQMWCTVSESSDQDICAMFYYQIHLLCILASKFFT